jgi:uncharacterized membrane protein (DUF485 family)
MAKGLDDVPSDVAGGRPEPAAAALLGDDEEAELDELDRRHRGFVFPATVFALVFYMALIFAAAWAPGFMSTKLFGAINVAYVFALAQFVMTFVLAWLYGRFARRRFDPLAKRLLETLKARHVGPAREADR